MIVHPIWRRARPAATCCAALAALTLVAIGTSGAAAAPSGARAAPDRDHERRCRPRRGRRQRG